MTGSDAGEALVLALIVVSPLIGWFLSDVVQRWWSRRAVGRPMSVAELNALRYQRKREALSRLRTTARDARRRGRTWPS